MCSCQDGWVAIKALGHYDDDDDVDDVDGDVGDDDDDNGDDDDDVDDDDDDDELERWDYDAGGVCPVSAETSLSDTA